MRKLFCLVAAVMACVALFVPEPTFSQASKLSARTGILVTPRNFPNQSADDISDMFRLTAEVGSFAVVRLEWSDPNLVAAAQTLATFADRHSLTSVLEVSPFKANMLKGASIAPPKGIATAGGRLSFANAAVSQSFTTSVLELAKLKPPFLAIATDVNLVELSDPGEFSAFAGVYRNLYPRIKEISPDTRIFVSFQWEAMQGRDTAANRRLLDAFGPRLDLLAMTSDARKLFDKSGPAGIPADYFANISQYSQGREVFVETHWPSEGRSGEADQVTFIRSLPRLMGSLKPAMVAWTLLHDVKVLLVFTIRAGLITPDGKQKPAYAAFRDVSVDRPSASATDARTAQTNAPRSKPGVANREPAHFGIYSARLDGSDVKALATSPDREMTHPRISPDGKHIVFTRYNNRGKDGKATEDGGYENTEIVVMNLDGSGLEVVVPPKRGIFAANGCWTPDGKSLIYISTDGSPAIRQIDLATRRITRVPTPAELKLPTDPHWERNKVVFPVKAAPDSADALWVMNADGTGARQVTRPRRRNGDRAVGLYGDFDPKLSPDESKVAFMRIDGGESWRVMVVDLAKGEERLLSPPGVIEGLPTWSSDGRLLLFRHIDRSKLSETGLWTMRPDGTERRIVPLPRGYLYNHGSFFPGEGSSPKARIIYTGTVMPGL
jgi:hypothetical protein